MHHSGVRHTLRLGVVLAFVALAVGACGAPEVAKPRTLPEDTRELDPGTYRTEEFEPAFSFEVDGGWATTSLPAPAARPRRPPGGSPPAPPAPRSSSPPSPSRSTEVGQQPRCRSRPTPCCSHGG